MPDTWTVEEICRQFPEGGRGATRAALAEFGISWPPPKGWRKALLQAAAGVPDAEDLELIEPCAGSAELGVPPAPVSDTGGDDHAVEAVRAALHCLNAAIDAAAARDLLVQVRAPEETISATWRGAVRVTITKVLL